MALIAAETIISHRVARSERWGNAQQARFILYCSIRRLGAKMCNAFNAAIRPYNDMRLQRNAHTCNSFRGVISLQREALQCARAML